MTILHRVGQPRGNEGIELLNKASRDTLLKRACFDAFYNKCTGEAVKVQS